METINDKIITLYKNGMSYEIMRQRVKISQDKLCKIIRQLKLDGILKDRSEKKANSVSRRERVTYEKKEFKYPAPDDAVDIMDLKHNSCRFPFHGTLFCGKIKTLESSYCKEHDKECVTMRTKTR